MKNYYYGLLAAGVMAFATASCATLDENECAVADWRQLGQSDGARGHGSSRIAAHQEACAKHGIPVNATAWRAGWDEGVRTYCTPQKALEIGLDDGYGNSAICPTDLRSDYDQAYRAGNDLFDARVKRNETKRKITDLTNSLVEKADEKERLATLVEIERERTRLVEAELALDDAEYDLDRVKVRLNLR